MATSSRPAVRFAFAFILAGGYATWACSNTTKEQLQVADLAKTCSLKSDCKSPLVCVFQHCHSECKDTSDCLDKYGKDSGVYCVSAENGDGFPGAGGET